MRPERLQLQGFTTFKESTVIDFAEVDLCAFSGATGSGKSSLIDAMVFALYGSIPRYDDKRRVAPAISQGMIEARVRFDFSVDGEFYTAVRVVRMNAAGTGASTKEARLERHGPDRPVFGDDNRSADGDPDGDDRDTTSSASIEVLAGEASGVTEAVESLLGLSFEHFTTCVVLPQGDFARFLHNKPSDRQALLVRLLDLGLFERMAELCRQRAASLAGSLEQVDARRSDLVTIEPERLLLIEGRVGELAALRERIDTVAPRLRELDDDSQTAHAAAVVEQDAIDRLEGISAPDDLTDGSDRLIAARDAAEAAGTELAANEQALVDAEASIAALPSRASLEQIQARWSDLERLKAQVAKGEKAGADVTEAHGAAVDKLAEAEQDSTSAAAELAEVRTKDLAVSLAADLSAGDACPVCGNEVHKLPTIKKTELTSARKRSEKADKALTAARDAAQKADVERIRVEQKLAGIVDQVDDLERSLVDGASPDEAVAELTKVDEAESAMVVVRTALAACRDAKTEADRTLRALEEREVAGRNEFEQVRDRVAPLEPPNPARTDLRSDWNELVDWADAERPVRAERLSSYKTQMTDLRADAERLNAEIDRESTSLGVSVRAGDRVRDAVVLEATKLAVELERIAETKELADQLDSEHATLTESRQVASTLSSHLRIDGFQKWVLDEALLRLVDGATGLLNQLSGGAYSLTLEEKTSNFAVIDHANADTVRSARTLSGGETFLASLALALALADQVAELAAGRTVHLESIFLDEGFGTLDPGTLDLVAGAIEELGAGGRMVGVVSHVRELALRLPIRFEVTKGPTTSTVARVLT